MASISLQLEDFRLNLFTLSFSEVLEDEFLADYFKKSLKHVRMALLLAIFFYSIFGLLDAWLAPEAKQSLWLIRYTIFVPFVAAVFLFSFHKNFNKYMQVSIALVILLAGLGIIVMTLLAPTRTSRASVPVRLLCRQWRQGSSPRARSSRQS